MIYGGYFVLYDHFQQIFPSPRKPDSDQKERPVMVKLKPKSAKWIQRNFAANSTKAVGGIYGV